MLKKNNKNVKKIIYNSHEIKYIKMKVNNQMVKVYDQLPSEYQRVEYIESTGTQYIDLGLKGTQNSSFDITFTITTMTNSRGIFGYYGGTTESFYIYSSGGGTLQYGYYNHGNVGNTLEANTKYLITTSGNEITINGTKYSNGYSGTFTTSQNIFLFNLSGGTYTGLPIKLYSFKFYEDDVLTMNLIPCYRKSDNVAGMYDIVTKTFFINSGTGDFIIGAEI